MASDANTREVYEEMLNEIGAGVVMTQRMWRVTDA